MTEQWVRQTLSAELLSDAHPGSGSGGGGIDALVARDRHDHPVIWATHVEGVLRDAARRLHGDKTAKRIFGSAGGERQRAVFTSLYAAGKSESHIWRSAASEAFDNRAPKDDTLRAIEHVPKGTMFAGELELPVDQLDTLKRLVLEVDAIGSGRSTGAGRVKLSLSEITNSEITSPPQRSGAPTDHLVLLLKNRDPLCITATATPDNIIPSLAFVPGRALLGALAAWLIADGHRETASLLTSGRVSVSDALPLPHAPSTLDGVEVLPAPLSLQSAKPKGTSGDLPWWAQPTAPANRLDAWTTKEKLKRPEDDLFVFRENASAAWTAFRPLRRVRLRNGRPEPSQADTSLFAIEQIVEETYFRVALHGAPDAMKQLADKLGPVLEGRRWLRVGRAGAPVEVAQLAWSGPSSAMETDANALLTLTSDLLVRDELLRWRTALDEDALREMLGDDVHLERAMQDSVMVHGFNGTSRLWRMPAAAIRRGSVFKVSGAGVAKLAERAARFEWLGERTHEGFGRFRIDASLPCVTGGSSAPSDLSPPPDHSDDAIAAKTLEWFNTHQSLAQPGGGSERKPSLSQWVDLVGDLARGDANAVPSRLNPTSAGGKNWKHKDAKAILDELNKIQAERRERYARFFTRWLRAKLRATSKEEEKEKAQ